MHSDQTQPSSHGSRKAGLQLPTDGQLLALCAVLINHPEKFKAPTSDEGALFADVIYLLVWSSGYNSLAKALQNPPTNPSPLCLHTALIELVSRVVKFYYEGVTSQPPRSVDEENAHIYSRVQRALCHHINLEQAIITAQLYSRTHQDSDLDINKCHQPFVAYKEAITVIVDKLASAERSAEETGVVPQRATPTKQNRVSKKVISKCYAGVERLELSDVVSEKLLDYKKTNDSFVLLLNYLQAKSLELGLKEQEARIAWHASVLKAKDALVDQINELKDLLSEYQELQKSKPTKTAQRLEQVRQTVKQLNLEEDSPLRELNEQYQRAVKEYNAVLSEAKAKKPSRQPLKKQLQGKIQALASFLFPVIDSECSTTKAAVAALDARKQQKTILNAFNNVRLERIKAHRRQHTPVKTSPHKEAPIQEHSAGVKSSTSAGGTAKPKNLFSSLFSHVKKGARKLFSGPRGSKSNKGPDAAPGVGR